MEKKNSRILALEAAKGLAIIFMVFVHVYEACAETVVLNTPAEEFFRKLIEFLGGGPAAPVFMFCMGVGFAYSTKAGPAALAKRAGVMALLALGLNLFIQWLPLLFREDLAESFAETAPAVIATDIYSFAALAMLLFAAVKALNEKFRVWVCLGLLAVFGLLNVFLPSVLHETGNAWLDTALGLFLRMNEWSYFPFVNWIGFPLLGYVLGDCYRKSAAKTPFKILLAVAGVLVLVGSWFWMRKIGMVNSVEFGSSDVENAYYAMSVQNVLFAFGVIVVDVFLCGLLLLVKPLEKLHRFLFYMSKNITAIYVAQWIWIGLATYLLDRVTSVYVSMLVAVGILLLSILSAFCFARWKNKKRGN